MQRIQAALRMAAGATALPGELRALATAAQAQLPAALQHCAGFADRSLRSGPAAAAIGWRPAAASGGSSRTFAAAAKATAAADDAALPPCEQRPQEQQANAIDEQLAASAQQGPEAVLAIVAADGERFSELNVVSALRAVADAVAAHGGSPNLNKKKRKTKKGGGGQGGPPQELVRSPDFQALIDMLLAGLQRFEPTLLAQAVAACAAAGAREEMLLDEVARHVMRAEVLAALSAHDLADLVCGMAALDHSPGVTLFEALAARAAQLRSDLSPQRQQEVRAAFEALGYAEYSPF